MKFRQVFLSVVVFHFLYDGIRTSIMDENDQNDRPENRGHRKRRKRPCGRNDLGKTFFDWSYSYINVNHNYNINCGGPQQGGYGQLPIGGGFGSHAANDAGVPVENYGEHDGNGYTENKNVVATKGGFSNFNFFDWLLGIKKTNDVQTFNVLPNRIFADVTTSNHQIFESGQYVSAYNPFFGNYVQKIGDFDPNRILSKVNKNLNQVFEPLYNILKK